MKGLRGLVLAGLVVGFVACDPIEARPLSTAPLNDATAHPCDAYEPNARGVRARPSEGRCEIPGRPESDYRFWIVVHSPTTSAYGAGLTFVLSSDDFSKPATGRSSCTPPTCLSLPQLSELDGHYTVTQQASDDVLYPQVLPDGTSIPVRVTFTPIGPESVESFPPLPLDVLFASSRILEENARLVVRYSRPVPVGRYRRTSFPQPPFDEYFPPRSEILSVTSINPRFFDDFRLGGATTPLDDVTGPTRVAVVKRAEGLAEWRVWLEDAPSGRRISVIKRLSGVEATVRLDTTGENRAGGGLGDDVNAIVAPPEGYVATPRLVTPLFGGQGLGNLQYPSLPPPVPVAGLVASSNQGVLSGFPARITLQSTSIREVDKSSTLLSYGTTVSTDATGRFSTVLPPGTYDATVEPLEGTGFAITRKVLEVKLESTVASFEPPPKTRVSGRVALTDERALSEAEVLALPRSPVDPTLPRPRPSRARTDSDGRFAIELDPGPYVFMVLPQAGTGFPRIAVRHEIPANETELPVMRVPAPTRLRFRLRAPTSPTNPVAIPIVRAIVRIFAEPGSGGAPVEIGAGMTDPEGAVEILLAQEPR